jgi:hypothetical protein
MTITNPAVAVFITFAFWMALAFAASAFNRSCKGSEANRRANNPTKKRNHYYKHFYKN